jgi:RNA polymerase sigma-70 factor (ECF subfamily)
MRAGGPADDAWGDLMRLALAGDHAAYRTLLEALGTTFRGLIRSRLAKGGRGNADVEDIVQEVLLAVHLKRHTWDPDLPFGPWVHAVARHKLIDALRRQGVRPTVSIDDVVEALPAPADMHADLSDAERLISQLNQRDQVIVRGIAIDGRSASEVGGEVGLTEGAVRVALHRALGKLARLFRGTGE